MLDEAKIAELKEVAEQNDGHCDRCARPIKFYKYRVNKTMAIFLRAMDKELRKAIKQGEKSIDIYTLPIAYSVGTQRSKMRQHGLIARAKNDKGEKISRHWLITTKGYNFLNGDPIQEKVVVFDNQVIGHEGKLVSIYGVLDEVALPEEKNITQPEARIYHEVREPKKYMKVLAEYQGYDSSHLKNKAIYPLQIERLQVGRPVKVIMGEASDLGNNTSQELEYRDINSFGKAWKIVETMETAA